MLVETYMSAADNAKVAKALCVHINNGNEPCLAVPYRANTPMGQSNLLKLVAAESTALMIQQSMLCSDSLTHNMISHTSLAYACWRH
jgi:hypothetical protein